MKRNKIYSIALALLSPLFFNLNAQSPGQPEIYGVNFDREEGQVCITDAERVVIKQHIADNIQMLKDQGKLAYNETAKIDNMLFDWPLKMADGVGYNKIWGISNYVDHQPGGGILDYNCGTRTYNGHEGTDIFTWPFWWYAMDHDQAEVVAAADGQIIHKAFHHDDRHCEFEGTWNAIYLQHADGTIGWYGHMKKNSLTDKDPGDMVTKGEFLGIVGSSGFSTGPHLHFEVYDPDGNLIDPYQGPCNSLNDDSWWEEQKPVDNPSINAVLTHSAPPEFFDCPQTEIPHLKNHFSQGDEMVISISLIDSESGSFMHNEVIRPDGTHLFNWDYEVTSDFQAYIQYWSNIIPDMDGTWKWRVTYKGETVTHEFFVGEMNTIENEIKGFSIYPNPANDKINIESQEKIIEAQIIDAKGRVVKRSHDVKGIEKMDIQSLPAGVYIIKGINFKNTTSSLKFIKK